MKNQIILIGLLALTSGCGVKTETKQLNGTTPAPGPVTCTYAAASNGSISVCSSGATIITQDGVGTYSSTQSINLCNEGTETLFKAGDGTILSVFGGTISQPPMGTWRNSQSGSGCQFYIDPSGAVGDNSGQVL